MNTLYDLWVHVLESGWKIHASDEKQCRISQLAKGLWIYDFEDWEDYDFGEPRLRVEALSKGKVKVTVEEARGAWHYDIYMGKQRILSSVGRGSVGRTVIARAVVASGKRESVIFPISSALYEPAKIKPPMRPPLKKFPLTSVTFLSTFEEACGIATYTKFLSTALMPKIPVYVKRHIGDVKGTTLCHLQHEYGIFASLNMLVGNEAVKENAKVITWHTVPKNFDDEVETKLSFRDYVMAVDSEYDVHIVHNSLAKRLLLSEVSQPIHIIPHGSAVWSHSSKDEARLKVNLPLDAQVCFAFGFAGEMKGFTELAEVTSELHKKYPKLLLVISGARHERVPPSESVKVKSSKSKGVLVLNRFLSEQEINLFADSADVLVFNYRHGGEFGSVSGAAHRVIACGSPIVCSDDSRLVEFQDGVHCLKHSLGDVEALKDSLETMLTQRDLAEELGRNVKLYAEATSWQRIAERHMQLYKTLCREE